MLIGKEIGHLILNCGGSVECLQIVTNMEVKYEMLMWSACFIYGLTYYSRVPL